MPVMPQKAALWAIAFVLIGCTPRNLCAAEEEVFFVSFDRLRLAQTERLARFDLRISPGMVIALCRVPVGWRIDIDNDPSWAARIRGIAIVGAADLDQKEFQHRLFSVLLAPEEVRRSFGLPDRLSVTGRLWLADDDQMRMLQIRHVDLSRSPEGQHCGA